MELSFPRAEETSLVSPYEDNLGQFLGFKSQSTVARPKAAVSPK